ncbi:MAG: 50S ribosome-binding GTPase, partial [Pseudomonadota bacterium]|nr:50S ribosome-binding GTPase [Pseudomonadota bacterium]
IVSDVAGTTRDLIEAPTAIGGIAFLLTDTAGLRAAEDAVEGLGIGRARDALGAADIILWLGDPADSPDRARAILVRPKADLDDGTDATDTDIRVSARTGQGMQALIKLLLARSSDMLPGESDTALNKRHRSLLDASLSDINAASAADDLLIAAEELRQARSTLDQITGRAGVEDMLDSLFGAFCIGK